MHYVQAQLWALFQVSSLVSSGMDKTDRNGQKRTEMDRHKEKKDRKRQKRTETAVNILKVQIWPEMDGNKQNWTETKSNTPKWT